MGSYHRRPLRDAHSSHRILRVHRAQRQSLPSVPTDILRNTVITVVSVSSMLYSPPSLTETTCLLLTYVLNLGVNAVDHSVPSNNTGLTLNAYVCSCTTPVRHFPVRHFPVRQFPVLQIPVLQIQLSRFSYVKRKRSSRLGKSCPRYQTCPSTPCYLLVCSYKATACTTTRKLI